MPLTGELEHLPIVDVIQLIHSTRKSGTLNVYSRKGEGKLVFNGGYIVGATHSSEQLRIGQILCECQIVSSLELEKALEIQGQAGSDRKPLIATLLEHCGLSKDAAFKALETLIELTIVEMISWTKGVFSFDVDKIDIFDEYRYLPTQLQEINLDTQMVLMDALRIFDEKVHAGEIKIIDEPLEDPPQFAAEDEQDEAASAVEEEVVVSEDILGLADLDKIERKKPLVFKSLDAFDPAEIHRQVIHKTLQSLPGQAQEKLANYFVEASKPAFLDETGHAAQTTQAIVVYSNDEFIHHALMTVCKTSGVMVFVTANSADIDDLINRALGRGLDPILIFDTPAADNDNYTESRLLDIRSATQAKYKQLPILQLVDWEDRSFILNSLRNGVQAAFPKPQIAEQQTINIEELISFLETLKSYLNNSFGTERQQYFAQLRSALSRLQRLEKASEISLLVLEFVGHFFERSLTLVVNRNELIAERNIGIRDDKDQGIGAAQKFRIALADNCLFRKAVQSPELFYAPVKDEVLEQQLFSEIGAPLESTVLLAPLATQQRTITLTYADFGNNKTRYVPVDLIEFFVKQAGTAMENALLRKQASHPPKPQNQH